MILHELFRYILLYFISWKIDYLWDSTVYVYCMFDFPLQVLSSCEYLFSVNYYYYFSNSAQHWKV